MSTTTEAHPSGLMRAARAAGVALAVLVGACALGELGGCGSAGQQVLEPAKELIKPLIDWVENPTFEASIGIKFEDWRAQFTGGLNLGWIRTGVGGGCLVVPLELCWQWP